ncbi:MAG: hypothetical protein ABIV43_01320 [Candidatus Saccharimonadales bacterium]
MKFFSDNRVNQKGFGTIELLLVSIMILLVGFIGFYVYNTQKSTDKLNQAATTNVPNAKKSATDSSSISQPTPAADYLTIKQWGVRMKLSAAIKDAIYILGHDGSQTDVFAGLSTSSLTQLEPYCGPDKTSVGALVRQTTAEHNTNASSSEAGSITNPVYDLQVGDHYYAYIHAQSACYSNDTSQAAIYYNTVHPDVLFNSDVKTLELVSQ